MYCGDDLVRHDIGELYGRGDKFVHIIAKRVNIKYCIVRAVISSNDEAEIRSAVGPRDDIEGIIGNSVLFDLASRH